MWDVKKAINVLSSQKFVTNGSLKDLTLKLTMLLVLTSADRASSIGFYLIKHPSEYIFHFGKTTKISTRTRERQPLKFYPFRGNKNLCVCHHVDLCLDKMKDFHKKEA